MRTKTLVYEVDDGFRGTAKEVAKRIGANNSSVFRAWKKKRPLRGHTIKKVGYNYAPYRLYRNGVFVFEGNPDEIANKIYVSPSSVLVALSTGRRMLEEYTVKRGDIIFVEK